MGYELDGWGWANGHKAYFLAGRCWMGNLMQDHGEATAGYSLQIFWEKKMSK